MNDINLQAEPKPDSALNRESVYSPFNTGQLFLLQQRYRRTINLLAKYGLNPLADKKILEVGCGKGGVLLDFLSMGARASSLHGVDILTDRLARAREMLGNMTFLCANGRHLPYAAGQFDLVLQFTAMSSILDPDARADTAHEMSRVLHKPGGLILWYDFWLNPTNRATIGLGPTEIRRLFPNCDIVLHRLTLAPPLARRLANVSWLLCLFLENLQIFNSHYLAAIRPL